MLARREKQSIFYVMVPHEAELASDDLQAGLRAGLVIVNPCYWNLLVLVSKVARLLPTSPITVRIIPIFPNPPRL